MLERDGERLQVASTNLLEGGDDTSIARNDAHDSLPNGAASVVPCHRRMRAGFVHKNQTRRGDVCDRREEGIAPGRNAFGVAFLGNQGLFLRVKPSRPAARTMVERETSVRSWRLYASVSSWMPQSGLPSTSRCTRGSISGGISCFCPPPCGRGSTDPVSRTRRVSRLIVAVPTANRSANSPTEGFSSCHARMIRRRRSRDSRLIPRFDHNCQIDASDHGHEGAREASSAWSAHCHRMACSLS